MWVKLLGEDVAGEYSIMENAIAARNGPPLHVHPFEEFFYILKGTFLFEVDGKTTHAAVGDFVHVSGNLPHVFQNISDEEGKVLLIARPAGVEKYFTELGRHAVNNPGDLAAMNALGLRYGIKILGPPIGTRAK
jgi:quercetin dioxygenase-like cupin family protein